MYRFFCVLRGKKMNTNNYLGESVIREEEGVRVHALNDGPMFKAGLIASLSRNPSSMRSRIESLVKNPETVESIMKFFSEYGHSSIGDCANIIISFEGIPHAIAHHIIHDNLFNGQEASTRYISNLESLGYFPISDHADSLSESMLELYRDVSEYFTEKLTSEKVPENEIKPAVCDIAGGFLPLTGRTSVVFNGTIRVHIRRLLYLENYCSVRQEFGVIPKLLRQVLSEVCPGALPPTKKKEERFDIFDYSFFSNMFILDSELEEERKNRFESAGGYKLDLSNFKEEIVVDGQPVKIKNLTQDQLTEIVRLKSNAVLGSIRMDYKQSFRTLRDIFRHRTFPFNYLSSSIPIGYSEFYYSGLSKELEDRLFNIVDVINRVENLSIRGNCQPMMAQYPATMVGSLSDFYSFIVTRTSTSVHPELSEMTSNLAWDFNSRLGNNVFKTHHLVPDYKARSKNDIGYFINNTLGKF